MSLRLKVALTLFGVFLVAIISGAVWLRYSSPVRVADGIFWQVDPSDLHPHGFWAQLGVKRLVVQYGVVDGKAWYRNNYVNTAKNRPNWRRIRHAPWARQIVMGLAGDYKLPRARQHLNALVRLSSLIYRNSPVPTAGYYFPVEVDPTWSNATRMRKALQGLPKPLWVSVYSRHQIKPKRFATWVTQWLPDGVGVLVQDGVGLDDRSPSRALRLARALERRIGRSHVGLIAEAFQRRSKGQFEPAPTTRLIQQLETYKGQNVYLYSANTLPAWQIWFIKLWFKLP